jgi:hypothetical protein
VTHSSRILFSLVVCAALVPAAHAHRQPRDITVEVIDSKGEVFRQVPTKHEAQAYRAYLEAEREARYRIRITNRSGERLAVVVTVDGRNIISGAKSELGSTEPMYVLSAGNTEEFSGWRANLHEVNEFYFTDWKDSYAEAFGDRSARGVIAVAVYREKESRIRQRNEEELAERGASGQAAPSASPRQDKAESADAGTGYGDRRTEHVTEVAFDAEPRSTQRVFLKYEWRETLCEKGILRCEEPNRFWPQSTLSFAPPPPSRR